MAEILGGIAAPYNELLSRNLIEESLMALNLDCARHELYTTKIPRKGGLT